MSKLKLSKTQIKYFERCPLSWYYYKIVGLKGKLPEEVVRGQDVHKVLEDTTREAEDYFEFVDKIDFEQPYEPYIHGAIKGLNEFKFGWEKPNGVELHLEYEDFHGIIDRLHVKDGKLYVVDYKTVNNIYNKRSIEPYMFELGMYALLAEQKFKLPVEEVGIIFIAPYQGKYVGKKLTDEEREELYNNVHKKVKMIINEIEKRLPNNFEARKGSWCWRCQFKEVCEAWKQ